jgi:hypothetical protein
MTRLRPLLAAACLALAACQQVPDQPAPTADMAQDGSSCMPFQRAVHDSKALDPGARLLNVADGSDATELIAFLNAVPPASNVDGDHVAIVFEPQEDTFLFIVGESDCATGMLQIPRRSIANLVGIET